VPPSVSFSPSPFSLLADIGSLVLLSGSFPLSQDEQTIFSGLIIIMMDGLEVAGFFVFNFVM
jgi:hypothetical protein